MKKGYAVLLLSALFAATVLGEDITTIDGTTYKEIRITETTPLGINFVSDDRACWVDFRDLPPDVAAKYGYDPVKAAEFEKSLAQNQGSTVTGDPAEISGDTTTAQNNVTVTAPDVAVNAPAVGGII